MLTDFLYAQEKVGIGLELSNNWEWSWERGILKK
jgi:hypothetical protein